MEYLKLRLLRECVKFVEVCQDYVLKGRLKVEEYCSLTHIKFDFIENIMEVENRSMLIDKNLSLRLNKLFSNDTYIFNLSREIVGK